MNFYELSKARYSVRKFKPDHLKQEDLEYILKCGRIAPTACNRQPQRVLVLNSDEDCEKLKRCQASQNQAPAALLVCYDKETTWTRRYDGVKSGDIDAAIVATHMMLAAAEIGVGSVWVMSFDPESVCDVLEIPENYVPVCFLMMGYPADDAEPAPLHDDKLPEEATVFYDEF